MPSPAFCMRMVRALISPQPPKPHPHLIHPHKRTTSQSCRGSGAVSFRKSWVAGCSTHQVRAFKCLAFRAPHCLVPLGCRSLVSFRRLVSVQAFWASTEAYVPRLCRAFWPLQFSLRCERSCMLSHRRRLQPHLRSSLPKPSKTVQQRHRAESWRAHLA